MQTQLSSRRARIVYARTRLFERFFLEHPHALGESYWEHQRHALYFGTSMVAAGIACVVHALVPALFVRTGSATIRRLYDHLIATKRTAAWVAANGDARGVRARGPQWQVTDR